MNPHKPDLKQKLPPTAAEEIVTALYRRFKDWSKRGFGPEDVTWCEVKADIEKLLLYQNTEMREVLRGCVENCTCPYGTCQWCERADALLTEGTK